MPSYRAIDPTEIDVNSPITAELADAWAGNCEGIAGGVSGAPRIQTAALDVDVVNQAAGRDIQTGDIGCYAFLSVLSAVGEVLPGGTVVADGTNLLYAGMHRGDTGLNTHFEIKTASSPVPTGTWRCTGYIDSAGVSHAATFVRVS
jgi:hypothetical protein